MKRVSTITLISQTETLDSIRQPVMTESSRTVYCTQLDVTRSEWIAAQQQSLSPSYRLLVFFGDYNGERIAIYNGRRFEIYRTFGAEDYIELYLGERIGEINAN